MNITDEVSASGTDNPKSSKIYALQQIDAVSQFDNPDRLTLLQRHEADVFYSKAHLSFIASIDFQFRQFVVIISISAQSERNARYTLCRVTSEKPQRKENSD